MVIDYYQWVISEYPKHLPTKDNLDESSSIGHKGEQPDDPYFKGFLTARSSKRSKE